MAPKDLVLEETLYESWIKDGSFEHQSCFYQQITLAQTLMMSAQQMSNGYVVVPQCGYERLYNRQCTELRALTKNLDAGDNKKDS